MAGIRLDKYLADAGAGTRSQVKEKIRKGKVTVNGQPAKKPELKVDPASDVVEAEGIRFTFQKNRYYMLHKPGGCVSATEDASERTVLELLPASIRRGLFPVGRLDKDTEGLLLLTDDGPLWELRGDRSYLGFDFQIPAQKVGTFDTELVEEFFLAFVRNANITLHLRQLAGTNSHHIIEGAFKAFGRVMRQAAALDPSLGGQIPSTKGVL